MLSYSQERVRIVMNCDLAGRRRAAARSCRTRCSARCSGTFPYDKKVRQGTHLGQPIVITAPQSVAARSLTDLATVIAGGRVEKNGRIAGLQVAPGAGR